MPPVRLRLSVGRFRKNPERPGNALRVFPGIPLESTAGIPQALSFKAFEASRAFPEVSPPQYGWRHRSREGLSELVMEFRAVLGAFLKLCRAQPFCPGDGVLLSEGQLWFVLGTGLVCPGHCPAQQHV